MLLITQINNHYNDNNDDDDPIEFSLEGYPGSGSLNIQPGIRDFEVFRKIITSKDYRKK